MEVKEEDLLRDFSSPPSPGFSESAVQSSADSSAPVCPLSACADP